VSEKEIKQFSSSAFFVGFFSVKFFPLRKYERKIEKKLSDYHFERKIRDSSD
jgi:hypothetical protein